MGVNTVNGQPARYLASDPTLVDGRGSALRVNINGYLLTTGATGSGSTTVQGTAADNAATVGSPVWVAAKYNSSAPTYDNGDAAGLQSDVNGNLKVREQYAPVYEDNTVGVAVAELRYSHGRATADTQIKGSAGFVHTVSIAPLTATPTAGLVTIYDNTAGSGTVIYSEWIFATDVGHTITLDVTAATGIYVEFDATLANVQVSVSYR